MITRLLLILLSVMFTVPVASAQPGANSSRAGGEILRQMRNQKIDLILPGAMRDNNVDMWIHVTRSGDPDPLVPQFGSVDK